MTERADLTIGFDSADSRTWPPNAESWFQVSYTHEAILHRDVDLPPGRSYWYQIPPTVFDRNLFNLAVYQADKDTLNDLMAAFPQWEISAPTNTVNAHIKWRLLWPYHPVISTFSDKGKVRNYTDKFSTYADLTTGQQDEVPPELEEHQDCIIFHKTFHFAIYHQASTVRWKMANHIAKHFQARPSPSYFQAIKVGTPGLPAPSAALQTRITQALDWSYKVMSGRERAYDPFTLLQDCETHTIPFIPFKNPKTLPSSNTQSNIHSK